MRVRWVFLIVFLFVSQASGAFRTAFWKMQSTLTYFWTWESGSSTANPTGSYGTPEVAAASNAPPPRNYPAYWLDANGLWLFGGGNYNDLWKWDGTYWTWIAGSNGVGQSGIYGTKGVTASNSYPGARGYAAVAKDSSGNVWIFGGNGVDSTGSTGNLNDLWKYDGTNWTWVSGSNTKGQSGTYGSHTPASGNVPGARQSAVAWTDATGNFWLFGGNGLDSAGATGYLNDLWKWDGTNWTWVTGSSTNGATGTYAGLGSTGTPGARYLESATKDGSGNFWIFGGYGLASTASVGELNDLWKWNGSAWTWVSGSSSINQSGVYGTKNTPSPGSVPGGRDSGVVWFDSAGSAFIFGGTGLDSTATSGELNDLWQWNGSAWIWISGSKTVNQATVPGVMGIAGSGNFPGARQNGASWFDPSNKLWLFGSYGIDSSSIGGPLNDLWSVTATASNAPAKLAFRLGPVNQYVNTCIRLEVVRKDGAGNATSTTSNTNVNLSSTGSGAFYSDSTCGTLISSVTIPAGNYMVPVYFKDSTVESVTVGAIATGLATGSAPLTLNYRTCLIYLSGTSTWTVTGDFNNTTNSIEVIGGGGGGGGGSSSQGSTGGGGGGYSKVSNVALTPGSSVGFSVGTPGSGGTTGGGNGGNGGTTYFCNSTSSCSVSGGSVIAQANGGTGGTISVAGAGATTATAIGSVKNAGGSGAAASSGSGGAGGGAAGPNGAGIIANVSNGGDADNHLGGLGALPSSNVGGAGREWDPLHGSGGGGSGAASGASGGGGGAYGGGGGGGGKNATGNSGGNGLIIISYPGKTCS